MRISELYGKSIEGTNGKRRGVILGVTYLNDEIEWLICCDEEEKKFYVAAKNACPLCGDTRFSKAGKAAKNVKTLRLGKAVYTSQGEFVGHLEDCILNGLKITSAVVGGKKIPFENLIVGDICILKDEEEIAELTAKNMFIDAVCGVEEPAAQ